VAVRYGVPVTVRVPATTANLGPGFDSLGMALDLHDEVTVEAVVALEGSAGPTVDVEVCGAGAGTVPLGEDHLVVRSVRAGWRAPAPAARRCGCAAATRSPTGVGWGSSASAVVAGLIAARGLLVDPALLDDATVFDLATAAEGHPDNASAAVFGGFTVSWTDEGPTGAVPPRTPSRCPVDPRLRVVVCVPDGDLATSRARAMLPATVPHGRRRVQRRRAALLVEGGDPAAGAAARGDRGPAAPGAAGHRDAGVGRPAARAACGRRRRGGVGRGPVDPRAGAPGPAPWTPSGRRWRGGAGANGGRCWSRPSPFAVRICSPDVRG
jgi:homoserine kinase